MTYFFISDIHGNIDNLNKAIEAFEREQADKLIILGDTASYSNNLINQQIADILNAIYSTPHIISDKAPNNAIHNVSHNNLKTNLEVIRGNCDTYDFEEMLDFHMHDIDIFQVNNKWVTITHGHYYSYRDLPPNFEEDGDIFIQGHTHVPMLQKDGTKIIANPGSITNPRGCDLKCYILLTETSILLKTLAGATIKELKI